MENHDCNTCEHRALDPEELPCSACHEFSLYVEVEREEPTEEF